ncbi:winged helix-turn-helix domain-containing protein [Haliscomenobacter hydrossis]|uniref:Transcriptional regulator n=1 Tax=Haliscomenobacter hydrossis (strain ATCC 27775 / DSM 1100 / LMG 10767 / O) TaxID=760192 RepID=F4L547_HALH1|nr:transcriptional regulator [Haliscomenobacter hydrossis]AEE48768.1 transcriptional regulator [Haliscomenobacter hydrossis DSM 1100]
MKVLIEGLSDTFDNRVRLGIMSMLMVNDWVEFTSFKSMLDLTDGRLASHLKVLEGESYIEVQKQFIGRKPNTSYRATPQGRKAFNDHLDALEKLLKLRSPNGNQSGENKEPKT